MDPSLPRPVERRMERLLPSLDDPVTAGRPPLPSLYIHGQGWLATLALLSQTVEGPKRTTVDTARPRLCDSS
jgi:hypothetical protein